MNHAGDRMPARGAVPWAVGALVGGQTLGGPVTGRLPGETPPPRHMYMWPLAHRCLAESSSCTCDHGAVETRAHRRSSTCASPLPPLSTGITDHAHTHQQAAALTPTCHLMAPHHSLPTPYRYDVAQQRSRRALRPHASRLADRARRALRPCRAPCPLRRRTRGTCGRRWRP